MPNYANITTTRPNTEGGFKPQVFFNETSEITTYQYPTSAGSTLGDKIAIETAHTWASGKGAWSWATKIGSVRLSKESAGDEGSKVDTWVLTFQVLGVDAATIEQMKNQLNAQLVFWAKDTNCTLTDFFYQLGDDCNPCTVENTFEGGDNLSTSTTVKNWTVTVRNKKLYTYEAALDTTF